MGKAAIGGRRVLASFDVTWEQIAGCMGAEKRASGGEIDGMVCSRPVVSAQIIVQVHELVFKTTAQDAFLIKVSVFTGLPVSANHQNVPCVWI